MLAPPPSLPVLYRDACLLVVDKPAGLVVHRGWANDEVTALTLARRLAGAWVYPVHRLDRGTSGVLVFALSPEIARAVEQAFAHEQIEKSYVALVRGLAPDEARVDHPLAKTRGGAKLPALTFVRRLESFEIRNEETGVSRRYSWVQARPISGRPHQIRRHLKHLGHPIIGDVRHGKAEHNRLFRRRFGLDRMVLHAERLTLPHPAGPGQLSLTAPLAPELERLLGAARAEHAAARDAGGRDEGARVDLASVTAADGGAGARD